MNDSAIRDKFVLLKNAWKLKKGKMFDSFGGLVPGVVVDLPGNKKITIKFYDRKWFRLK